MLHTHILRCMGSGDLARATCVQHVGEGTVAIRTVAVKPSPCLLGFSWLSITNFGWLLREGSLGWSTWGPPEDPPEDLAGCSFPSLWPGLLPDVWSSLFGPYIWIIRPDSLSVRPTGKGTVCAIQCSLVAIMLVFGCWVFCWWLVCVAVVAAFWPWCHQCTPQCDRGEQCPSFRPFLKPSSGAYRHFHSCYICAKFLLQCWLSCCYVGGETEKACLESFPRLRWCHQMRGGYLMLAAFPCQDFHLPVNCEVRVMLVSVPSY